MENFKHIILGAGGAISPVLTDELLRAGEKVKLVSRKGTMVEGTESAMADVTQASDISNVVEESSIVYLLVGLQYNLSVWRENWPKIMDNVIEACKAKNARLIFFDNVYMYGLVRGRMTEESPMNPSSRKGEIRAKIADKLLTEAKNGNISAMIARSADFYGPHTEKTGLPFVFFFERLSRGKKAQSLVSVDKLHSYTYTGDCGKALYMLSKTDDAFNQVWHMPTAQPALTGKQFIEIAARKLGVEPSYMILRKWMVWLGGIFDKQVREVYEMLYQNQYDYVFDSTKFEERFDFQPTPYEKGIEETVEHFRSRGLI